MIEKFKTIEEFNEWALLEAKNGYQPTRFVISVKSVNGKVNDHIITIRNALDQFSSYCMDSESLKVALIDRLDILNCVYIKPEFYD